MTQPKHHGVLNSLAQSGLCSAHYPQDGEPVAVRNESFLPFAAWLLKTFRNTPELESVTLSASLRVVPQHQNDVESPTGVTLHTDIELDSAGVALFTNKDHSHDFVMDFLPGALMSAGTFTFDRSAVELQMLDDLDAKQGLDVELVARRLALRVSYAMLGMNVVRTYGFKS